MPHITYMRINVLANEFDMNFFSIANEFDIKHSR